METVNNVKEALTARSRTATLDELRSEGRRKVRLIKAEHVAALIAAAVHAAIEQSGLIPQEEADNLVAKSRQEFQTILAERAAETRHYTEIEDRLREREAEIEQLKAQLAGGGGAVPGGARPAAAAAGGIAATPDVTAALEKLAGSLNERLEKLGKKMGISAAVEGGEVKFDGLFKSTDKDLESNMGNVEVKQKAGGGIAANLAKLKKLKGGS
jgi:hypothetical protein